MLNSVLIEGIIVCTPNPNERGMVEVKIRHDKKLTVKAFASGSLGLECNQHLKQGMKVRIVGKLCTKGLQVSYIEYNCKDMA